MTAPDPQDRIRSVLARVPTSDAPVDDIVAAGERRRRTRRSRLAGAGAAVAVVVVAVAALAVDQGPPDVETVTYPSPVDLSGDWRVTALYADTGREVPLDGLSAPVDLTFDPDDETDAGGSVVSGHDGCNSFGGPYTASGDRVTVAADEVVSTAMGCEQSVPLIERLGDVRTARTTGPGIELLDADGEVVVELEPVAARVDLAGTWQVTALRDRGEPVALRAGPEALTVEFGEPDTDGEGLLRIGDGCNRLEGRFRIVGAAFSARRTRGIDEPFCPAFDTLVSRLGDLDTALSLGRDEVELLDPDGLIVARLERESAGDTEGVDLDGTWRVTAAPGLDPRLRPTRVRVTFDLLGSEGTVRVTGDCNGVGFGLDLRTDGALVTMTPRAQRQPYCSAGELAGDLEGAATVRAAGEDVELRDADADLVVRLAPAGS